MQGITDAEERRQLSKRMNDLFVNAKELMDKVKFQRGMAASIERELSTLGIDS